MVSLRRSGASHPGRNPNWSPNWPPNWMEMSEYFAMGGYAAYVWPAYAVTLVMLVGTLVATLAGLRRREAMVKALEAARPPRPSRRERAPEAPAAPAATGAPETDAPGTLTP